MFKLRIFVFLFLLFVFFFFFLQVHALVVAFQSCMERIPIGKKSDDTYSAGIIANKCSEPKLSYKVILVNVQIGNY